MNSTISSLMINDKNITIRSLSADDVAELQQYINQLSSEQTYITFQGEQVSLEEESTYVAKQLQGIYAGDVVHLVVEAEGTVIGTAEITRQPRVEAHVGLLGISVRKEWRGKGIGKKLLSAVISEAEKHLDGIRIIRLVVYENNTVAYNLYRSLGFVEYGRLPKGIYYKGGYMDAILMYKMVEYAANQ